MTPGRVSYIGVYLSVAIGTRTRTECKCCIFLRENPTSGPFASEANYNVLECRHLLPGGRDRVLLHVDLGVDPRVRRRRRFVGHWCDVSELENSEMAPGVRK